MRQLLPALALISVTACGGGKVERFVDKIRGKKDEPKPFKVDMAQLRGIYIVQSLRTYGDWNASYFGSQVVDSNQEAWQITDTTITRYDARLDDDFCGARAYRVDGDATLVLAAKDACPEMALRVLSQYGGTNFAIPRAAVTVGDRSYDAVMLKLVSDAELRDAVAVWDAPFRRAPVWLKPALLTEASEAAILPARAEILERFVGATMTLTLATDGGEFIKEGFAAFGFQNGKQLGTIWDVSGDKAVSCVVLQKVPGSFERAIKSVKAMHPRREGGTVVSTSAADAKIEDNPRRGNAVALTFGDDLQISCSKRNDEAPITAAEVEAAFGTLARFTK